MCTFARSSAGGDKKEFIGCHQVGHALHENWWNQHLEQFIYICSDTLKTKKKKSKTNPEQPKKKQLRKTWKKICIDDGGVTAEWRVHTKKKKPKLKMEPPKKKKKNFVRKNCLVSTMDGIRNGRMNEMTWKQSLNGWMTGWLEIWMDGDAGWLWTGVACARFAWYGTRVWLNINGWWLAEKQFKVKKNNAKKS